MSTSAAERVLEHEISGLSADERHQVVRCANAFVCRVFARTGPGVVQQP
jgi:hypothetical protein